MQLLSDFEAEIISGGFAFPSAANIALSINVSLATFVAPITQVNTVATAAVLAGSIKRLSGAPETDAAQRRLRLGGPDAAPPLAAPQPLVVSEKLPGLRAGKIGRFALVGKARSAVPRHRAQRQVTESNGRDARFTTFVPRSLR